jgi:hypothetical protein
MIPLLEAAAQICRENTFPFEDENAAIRVKIHLLNLNGSD